MNSSPLQGRFKKAQAAFEDKDAASSRAAHDDTIKAWEEDGHNAGEVAKGQYRRIDAFQTGLCIALVVEAVFGALGDRRRCLVAALVLAGAHGFKRAADGLWYKRHYDREHGRETWELENYEAGERDEMVGLWNHKGLRRDDAEKVIDILATYKAFFVGIMMTEELGLFAPVADLGREALGAGACVAAGALAPLLIGSAAEAAGSARPFAVVVATGAAALGASGAQRAAVSKLDRARHALESAAVGVAVAAAANFLVA